MPLSQGSKVRLAAAQAAVRQIEKFALGATAEAEGPEVREARTLLQITTGLRRKLDSWGAPGEAGSSAQEA